MWRKSGNRRTAPRADSIVHSAPHVLAACSPAERAAAAVLGRANRCRCLICGRDSHVLCARGRSVGWGQRGSHATVARCAPSSHCSPQVAITCVLETIFVMIVFATWLWASLVDPGERGVRPFHVSVAPADSCASLGLQPLLPYPCMRFTQSKRRFCSMCRKEIQGLDHHCVWCVHVALANSSIF